MKPRVVMITSSSIRLSHTFYIYTIISIIFLSILLKHVTLISVLVNKSFVARNTGTSYG